MNRTAALDARINKFPVFIKFLDTTHENKNDPTIVHVFCHDDGFFTIHYEDAQMAAHKIFQDTTIICSLQYKDHSVPTVYMDKKHLGKLFQAHVIAMEKKLHVFKMVDEQKWIMSAKVNKNNTKEMDVFLGDDQRDDGDDQVASSSDVVLSVRHTTRDGGDHVDIAVFDHVTSVISYASFADSTNLTNLESVVVQTSPKECLYLKNTLAVGKILEVLKRNGVKGHESSKKEFDARNIAHDLKLILQKTLSCRPEVGLRHACAQVGVMSCVAGVIARYNMITTAADEYADKYLLKRHELNRYMRLDRHAVRALNLFPDKQSRFSSNSTATSSGSGNFDSLYALLNRCRTAGGEKLLRRWIAQPLVDVTDIQDRHKIVAAFTQVADLRQKISDNILKKMPDFEKLTRKFERGKTTLKDCYQVYQGLQLAPLILACVSENSDSLYECGDDADRVITRHFVEPLERSVDELGNVVELVEQTLDFDAIERHEYQIRYGFTPELIDEESRMRELEEEVDSLVASVARLLELEPGAVKLELAPSSGNYLYRITCKEEKKLRAHAATFTLVDTAKNGIRFFDGELMKVGEELAELKSSYKKHQEHVVREIMDIVRGYKRPLLDLNHVLSTLDVLVSFAQVVATSPTPYCRPKMLVMDATEPEVMTLKSSRHPCVERQEGVTSFIANDAVLRRGDHSFVIVTGPNMAGKSTYIRQLGVVALMAQIGMWVPCEEATLRVLDAILARVGAGDSQMRGISTFLGEMMETGTILESATANSLVIVDELGRGTSTCDGFGLAWSISRHIATKLASPCLFATHFHEMTALTTVVEQAVNYHVTAMTDDVTGEVTMLHQVQPGVCDQSYGISVARSVGFPDDIVEAARCKADKLENFYVSSTTQQHDDSSKEEGEAAIDELMRSVKNTDWRSMSREERIRKLKGLKEEVMSKNNHYINHILA